MGSLKRRSPVSVFLVVVRIRYMSTIVTEKPNKGEIKSDKPISCAFPQLTASLVDPGRSENAKPTPNMDPINVCELEHGIPRYQVSRFQKIADSNRAITIDML